MKNTTPGKWLALSVISLGMGGSFAFLVGMSRMPGAANFFPENYFSFALIGHVDLAILCWLMISAILIWNRNLNAKPYEYSFAIGAAGVALITVSSLFAMGEPVLNNYVPTIVSPVFFTGLALFFLAFSLNVLDFLVEGLIKLSSNKIKDNAIGASILISVVLIAAAFASILILGNDEYSDSHFYYEGLFWTPGHIQQVLNASLLVTVWYALLETSTGEEPKAWPWLAKANIALILSAVIILIFMFLFEPLSRPQKIGAEIVYGLGIGIPLFLHIANILRQFSFQAKKPASSALILSITIYLFGIFIAYGGFDNDTRVPAHYHGAVTALTLGLMAHAFHMFSSYGLKVKYDRLARTQPYIYGVGMVLFIAGLFVSGLHGAPRKTHGVEWTDDPTIIAAMTMMGVGTLLAVAGGAIFVVYAGMSIIKEEKEEAVK